MNPLSRLTQTIITRHIAGILEPLNIQTGLNVMKLIIQIPCLNEAETLPIVLSELPRQINGFDKVEWLIIDDGSSDSTADVAKAHGVDHVVRNTKNQGLARTFMTGIETALSLGADVIVNTDADNQYRGQDIETLVKPILEKKADLVIGERPIQQIQHFSWLKKLLQRLGSWVVRVASGTNIPDAPSGFRAISRAAAAELNVFNEYTYTLETIIQAGQRNMAIVSVPIGVNEDLRPSRLVKSIPSYIKRSIVTIVRIFVIYKPFSFFGSIGLMGLIVGTLLGFRFIFYWLTGQGDGHIQSLILAAVFLTAGFQTLLVAFLADQLAANRQLLQQMRARLLRGSSSNTHD